jgi:hypothetical protein
MARFIYDVDKTTRYIDIHKQFGGGLKTVDTDDSLKDVYLREAENISLSEFNFIEKRYGLHKLEEHVPWSSLTSVSSIVQGYFEYYVDSDTVDKIIVIEGKFYVNRDGNGFEEVEFFTIPPGVPFFDLAPLGIYTDDVVNEMATPSASPESYFGTQTPRFLATAPVNGVTVGIIGQKYYSFSNDTYYVCSSTTTNWTSLGTSASDSYPAAGFVQGEFYHDTTRNLSYKWNEVSGKTGIMTANANIYKADIQTTRPVEGVRVDDKLYIATGTYPVYYMGDGKIYVMPQYEMSDLDIAGVNGLALGYNLNSLDLEAALTNSPLAEDTDQVNTGAIALTVKNHTFLPRLPYVSGTLEFQVSYTLGNNATYTYYDTNFNTSTSPTDYGTVSAFPYTVSPDKANWIIKPIVYRRRATIGGEYTQVPETEISYITLTNDENTAVTALSTYDRLPLTSTDPISNMSVTVKELTSGYWDYKVVVSLIRTGYTPTFSTTVVPTVQTQTFARGTVEFLNVWITPEELTDYQEEPYDTLKVHTCNRITEHNGRLCLFGSTTHPDYLFFSTISAKEYFPYSYSLQFTNDLQEPVNSVTKFMNILVVQSPSYTWGIKGDSPFPLSAAEGDIYRKITINPTIGCIAPHSVKNVRNQLYFLSKEGIFTLRALFAEDNRYNVDPIDRNIYNIVPRDTNAIATYFDDQYWLHFPTTGETLRYYVDKKAWVKDNYAAWNDFGGVHKYINDSGKLRFITELSQLAESGSVQIFDVEVDYSLPSDLGQFFESRVTTSFLNQNQPFHPKNYKEAKMDFTLQNEYNIGKEPIVGTSYGEGGSGASTYILFNAVLTPRHFYQITLDKVNVPTTGSYIVYVNDDSRASGTFTNTDPVSQSWLPIEFQILDTDVAPYTIKIVSSQLSLANIDASVAVLKDSTYDNSITFTNVILSEEGTLNIDPIQSYSQSAVERVVNLGTRLGNWTFGTSNFGNIITAVETIKLSGRGYNCKISITENGKSKWTLESLGITYKMKKARSR